MVLCAHSDAGFHNEKKGGSRAEAHIFLSENEAMPRWNGPVLPLAKNHLICHVLCFWSIIRCNVHHRARNGSDEADLQEMKWPQPKTPSRQKHPPLQVRWITPSPQKSWRQWKGTSTGSDAENTKANSDTTGKWKPELGRLQYKTSSPPLSWIQKNAIIRKSSQRHQIPVRFQQGCIVPSARWNLLQPGTLTHRAYTAT